MMEDELSKLLEKEEAYWRQRSRAIWLKEGDKNTSFFHNKANQRQKRNTIKKTRDQHGNWIHGRKLLAETIRNYFMGLFASESTSKIDEFCSCIQGKLNQASKEELTVPFTHMEVKEALNQMHWLKAPGPDGFPALFFQRYWNLVGEDVVQKVLSILNEGVDPVSINRMFIFLIPKVKVPESPKNLRPISLCNVIMKLVTKCIANRLKPLLGDIVSEQQSAFIPGRLITDNELTGFEVFHYMKQKRKGKKGYMAVKLDMTKAYDRIELVFL